MRLALIEIVFNSIGIDHYDRDATSDDLLEEYAEYLSRNNIVDKYIPWLAQQLVKERSRTQREAADLLDSLRRGFRKVCVWASETRQNIAGMSLRQALEASRDYQNFAQQKGKAESDVNPTLHRFANGWKVVELHTEKALEREGNLMNHCAGECFERVENEESRIFSLRDPDNNPHITMEYLPDEERFTQILGPANEKPQEYTRPYLIEFIEEKFEGNPLGLLMAGVPAQALYLRGANLSYVNLQSADLEGADLQGADLQGANLRGVKWNEDTSWEGAEYKDETVWPEGFDPDAAGAVFAEE